MKYIDAERLQMELEKRLKNVRDYMNGAGMKYKGPKYFKAQGKESAYDALLNIIDSLQQEQPEVFDTVAFQKGVAEGRRLEREDALTIADIEKLHTFLYAVKNNKHGMFTFTLLTDEQYEEVLRRFNNAKEK